eukprot:scaffold11_cov257-Pinguiococcus_pyrenoidosus.AAC.37
MPLYEAGWKSTPSHTLRRTSPTPQPCRPGRGDTPHAELFPLLPDPRQGERDCCVARRAGVGRPQMLRVWQARWTPARRRWQAGTRSPLGVRSPRPADPPSCRP